MNGAADSGPRRPSSLLAAALRSEYLVLLLCAGLFAGLAPFTPGLATADNLLGLLGNLAPLLVVALGQTVVLVAGGIDLSVTSTIALTSVVGALAMNRDTGWLAGSPMAAPVAVLLMLGLGGFIGAGNGLAVAKLRMPPFMVSLTAMMFVSGFAIWLTQSKNVGNLPAAFTGLGSRPAVALPLAAAAAGLVHLLLERSLYGRWLRAAGFNARTARVSGVPVEGVVVAAYVASGVLAAAASVLYTGRLETGSPVLGQRILLDVVGATVIGGTSLFGGKGKVSWTFFGVLFLALLDNALNILDLSHFAIMMVKGGVILLAALLDTARNRWFAA
jgi:ribose/xylose/arabinose/galactoside ABC-type transport system permease subunit